MTRRAPLLIGAVVGALATMLLGGIAWAAIPGADGVIQGCYDSGGNVKVVEALPCPKNHTPFRWNQQGLPGQDGDDGALGGTSTYVREWAPFGTLDFGADGLFNPGEITSGTAECLDLNDQLTGAGISSIEWSSATGASGLLTGSVVPLSATPTTKEGADFKIANTSPEDLLRAGAGWIICTVVD